MPKGIYKRKPLTREHKKSIGKGLRGKKRSEEVRRKMSESQKGKQISIETRKKMSLARTGIKLSDEIKKKMRLAHKGKKMSKEHCENISKSKKGCHIWSKGKKFSKERRKISESNKGKKHTEETKAKLSKSKMGQNAGEKHYCWKGGVTPINMKIRNSKEYKIWREAVFERDNWTCVWCKTKSGKGKRVVLNADHIKPFALFPELRLAIDNGRTLCVSCHKKTDTYGIKNSK
jgi:5-methylcytosine-specific restriction endonuclease McrA